MPVRSTVPVKPGMSPSFLPVAKERKHALFGCYKVSWAVSSLAYMLEAECFGFFL
jgi:hypothetical protein